MKSYPFPITFKKPTFGRLDVLVNNAGVFRLGAFAEITEENFHLDYNINVLGAILAVHEAIKRFGTDGGSIINLSSILGSHPVMGALLYVSTKDAIETLTSFGRILCRGALVSCADGFA